MNLNIVIGAVGGQGALLASRVLGQLAVNLNLDTKISEVHGMSQRGGSVVTYVRIGEQVHSPLVEKGTADVVLAFELLEAARYVNYLKKGGTLIANTQKIPPITVLTGASQYPADIIEKCQALEITPYFMDALALAKEAGNSRAVNSVLLGKMAKISSFEKDAWIDAFKIAIPSGHLQANLGAFEKGYSL